AMCWLSMGGAATVNTAFSRPDLFGSIIIMSAGGPQNLGEAYPKFFGNDGAAAKRMKLIWIAAGDQDFALNGAKALDAALTKHGITQIFKTTPGRHEWRLWRPHLYEVAQLLVQPAGARAVSPQSASGAGARQDPCGGRSADPRTPCQADVDRMMAALPDTAPARPLKPRTVLVLGRAVGFVHSSIPLAAK